jgi:hypothetical protein
MMSIDYVQTRIDTTAGMLECPVCRNTAQFVEGMHSILVFLPFEIGFTNKNYVIL